MAEPTPDSTILQWLFGGGAAASLGGLARWFFTRLDAHKAETDKANGAIWGKLAEHDRLLRDVPTKADLATLRADLRGDITFLLQGKRQGTD